VLSRSAPSAVDGFEWGVEQSSAGLGRDDDDRDVRLGKELMRLGAHDSGMVPASV
jgi:hypothetical protein